MASKITALTEEHGLLPPQHMGAHPGRSTDTALDMLVNQVHAAWQADNGVASLLSLDMTGAFDRVVPVRLLHNLRKRCIPQWLVNFISSFLSDSSTTLCFLASLLVLLRQSKAFPKALLSLRFFSFSTMLTSLKLVTPRSPCYWYWLC